MSQLQAITSEEEISEKNVLEPSQLNVEIKDASGFGYISILSVIESISSVVEVEV